MKKLIISATIIVSFASCSKHKYTCQCTNGSTSDIVHSFEYTSKTDGVGHEQECTQYGIDWNATHQDKRYCAPVYE